MAKWGSLVGYVGLVAILFAFLGFVLGLFVPLLDLTWIRVNWVIGLVALVIAGVSNAQRIRQWMGSEAARRMGKHGTSSILSTVFAILILAMLAYMSTRYSKRFDWTVAKVHSLSDQTVQIIEGLERDLIIEGFYPATHAGLVRDLLGRYDYLSPRVRVEFWDPNARVDLVEKYQLAGPQLEKGVVRIQLGDESVNLVGMITEDKVTNALVRLTKTQSKKVYFLTGHNERRIGMEEGQSKVDFFEARTMLENENYQVEELLLVARGAVPQDADVVIIAGPTRPFAIEEHIALQDYLYRGGSIFLMIDPRSKTDLYDDIRGWGVEVRDDVVIDLVQSLPGQPGTPVAATYHPQHPIVKDLREVSMFHTARSVAPLAGNEARFSQLVFSGEQSWGETNLEGLFGEGGELSLDEEDHTGPVAFGLAGEPLLPELDQALDRGARIVVFGDVDFASNQLIQLYANRDLFVNSVNWLVGDEKSITIRPAITPGSFLTLTAGQSELLRYLSLMIIPEMIALVGIVVFWARRQPAGR